MENPIHTINLSRMVVIGQIYGALLKQLSRIRLQNPVILDDPITRKIIGKKYAMI